jgi:hypothetical protein
MIAMDAREGRQHWMWFTSFTAVGGGGGVGVAPVRTSGVVCDGAVGSVTGGEGGCPCGGATCCSPSVARYDSNVSKAVAAYQAKARRSVDAVS